LPGFRSGAGDGHGAGMSRTVLVTGGNGFVGRHLVAALQDRGDLVRVLALPGEDASWLRHRGVAVYHGDVREPASLAKPADGADAVLPLEIGRASGRER